MAGRPASESFKGIEYEAWTRKAAAYDDWFAQITRQTIGPMLSALGGGFLDKKFLDICTGTGHLAAAAADQGAAAEGVDFAEAMVEIARRNYPRLTFYQGDAENLPCPDNTFDFAANAFGLWHLGDAEVGFREAYRVLRPGGRFAFSTWLPPDRGFDLFGIIIAATQSRLAIPFPLNIILTTMRCHVEGAAHCDPRLWSRRSKRTAGNAKSLGTSERFIQYYEFSKILVLDLCTPAGATSAHCFSKSVVRPNMQQG